MTVELLGTLTALAATWVLGLNWLFRIEADGRQTRADLEAVKASHAKQYDDLRLDLNRQYDGLANDLRYIRGRVDEIARERRG